MRARILDESVLLRREASGASPVVAALRAGDEVILGNSVKVAGADWIAACSGVLLGYMPGATKTLRVRVASLAQRAVDVQDASDGGAPVIDILRSGDSLSLTAKVTVRGREWLTVDTGTGVHGYVPAETKVKEATEVAPGVLLAVTVETAGWGSRFYCEASQLATLNALGADIRAGAIGRMSRVSSKSTGSKGKIAEWSGTLEGFARRHGSLASLYWPIRQFSRRGLGFGALIGGGLYIFLDGFAMFQVNQSSGALVMALPICMLITGVPAIANALPSGLRSVAGFGAAAMPFVIGISGLFTFVLGGAVAGALLLCFPGMAVGAIVGATRRDRMPVAPDAIKEPVFPPVAVAALATVAIWVVYIMLVNRYLPDMLPGFIRAYQQ